MNAQKSTKFGWLACAAVVFWLAAAVQPAAAGNFYWSNTGGGDYAVGGNWSSNAAPGAGDATYFTNNADYAVTWNADATAAGATFNAASGTVTLNLGSYTWVTPVTIGNAAGYSTVVQNGGTLQATNGFAVGSGGGKRGSMALTNSGRLFTRGQNVGAWGGGSGCALVVAGTGTVMTVLDASGGYSHQWYENASQVVVTNGGALNDDGNGHVYIGNDATSTNNTWVVTGAGSVYSNTAGMSFYLGSGGSGNRLTVSDGGAFYTPNFMTSTSSNQVLVTGSNSILSLGYSTAFGNGPGGYNTLTVTNGGRASFATYSSLGYVTNAPGNTIIVTGPGSSFRTGNRLTVGGASIGNRVAVRDGAQYSVNGALTVGSSGVPTNNLVEVSGAGSLVACASGCLICVGSNSTMTVEGVPCNGSGGSLLLWNGGGVELQGSARLGSGYGGTGIISNYLGGIFQFTALSASTINNGTPGSIVINGGTVSFRALTTASVFCNQSGQPLDSTKLLWLGDNTFRLNNATNVAGQNYTFQTGTGTNFAGLSLINGSRYRGNVTVGTGGTLSCSDGPETLAGSLTMQPDSTMALTLSGSNDTLTVTGAVNLAGAQLQVTLNADPTPYYPIRFLRTGGLGGSKFSTRTIEAQYRGTNFGMKVQYDANNQDVLLYDEGVKGTLILLY